MYKIVTTLYNILTTFYKFVSTLSRFFLSSDQDAPASHVLHLVLAEGAGDGRRAGGRVPRRAAPRAAAEEAGRCPCAGKPIGQLFLKFNQVP